MMRHVLLAGVTMLVAGLCLPHTAPAQRRPSGGAVIEGTVRDTVRGHLLTRTRVCVKLHDSRATFWTPCALLNSSGFFRLVHLPEGTWKVTVSCETGPGYGKVLASDPIAVSEAAPVRRDWTVDRAGCDPRPLRLVRGVFRGYYTMGYEVSDFVPCFADAWFLSSDAVRYKRFDQQSIWASLNSARFSDKFRWPNTPRGKHGTRYYVHWRGTVIGPGHYGHFSMYAFELRVDRVLELRDVREGDCRSI